MACPGCGSRVWIRGGGFQSRALVGPAVICPKMSGCSSRTACWHDQAFDQLPGSWGVPRQRSAGSWHAIAPMRDAITRFGLEDGAGQAPKSPTLQVGRRRGVARVRCGTLVPALESATGLPSLDEAVSRGAPPTSGPRNDLSCALQTEHPACSVGLRPAATVRKVQQAATVAYQSKTAQLHERCPQDRRSAGPYCDTRGRGPLGRATSSWGRRTNPRLSPWWSGPHAS